MEVLKQLTTTWMVMNFVVMGVVVSSFSLTDTRTTPPSPAANGNSSSASKTTTKNESTANGGSPPTPLPPRPPKPHIVLIVADDLGWNDVSWHNPSVGMPHLDELAKGGVILNQSYVLPTCTPTRAALLTGRYPFTFGMQKGALNPQESGGLPLNIELLPQTLRKQGYSAHAIGKWHLGYCDWLYTPVFRGFDSFYGSFSGTSDYYTHKKKKKSLGKKTNRIKTWDPHLLDLWNNTSPDTTKNGIYSTYLFATAAENIIHSRNPKNPMFLYVPFQSVHAPLQVPKNYTRGFRHVKDYSRRNYLGMILAMDDAVGRIVAALKATGHYENSVIIFTTDNGGAIKTGGSNWPLRGGKANLLEGGTRGPAFIHSPHLPHPGTVYNHLFHVTDWFSTVVSLAGGEPPMRMDGYNQWHALSGLAAPPRNDFVYNIDNTDGKFRVAVRLNDMKLSVGRVGNKVLQPEYRGRELVDSQFYILPKNYSDSPEIDEIFSPFTLSPLDLSDSNATELEKEKLELQPLAHILVELMSLISAGRNDHNAKFDTFSVRNPRYHHLYTSLYPRMTKSRGKYSKNNMEYRSNKRFRKRKSKQKTKQKGSTRKPLTFRIRDCEKKRVKETKSKENYVSSKLSTEGKRIEENKNKMKIKRKRKKKKRQNKLGQSPRIRGHIKWKFLKKQMAISLNPQVMKRLDRFFDEKLKIRLYNITDDPGETKDISRSNLSIVRMMLNYVDNQLLRFVPMKKKILSDAGDPENQQSIWTPGWCQAQ
ncbi:hypothetical protein SK128_026634 [Halocaridina rubra]|uniref:Sulfatase N-terminal domain-containing protein n=1 Tax=Halocaridina rubra TaxID=373956 RepID=A0AAN8X9K2_HALRR